MKIKKTKNLNVPKTVGNNKGNVLKKIILGFIAGFVLVGVYFGLSSILATESYYVLNTDLPGKVQVRDTMLNEIITSKGSAPQNAISKQDVQQGFIYTKIPLKIGDVLSESNTSVNVDIGAGIPDTWGITSFKINAENAVAGNIIKGDYFDIIGVNPKTGAKYLFTNVLALDFVQAENNEVGSDGKLIKAGSTVEYIVGMPSEDIGKLHSSIATYNEIKLVLSPKSLKYDKRDISNLDKSFIVTGNSRPVDLFLGSDNTFTPVLRDKNERPVNIENCNNNLVEPAELCDQLKTEDDTNNEENTNNNEENTNNDER